MAETQLNALAGKIDELIALCDQLTRENQQLRAENARWQQERRELLDKNELARSKVAAMIERLRSMEQIR